MADPTPCVMGSRELTVTKGTEVQICWGMAPSPTPQFFRIRRSFTQAGSWDQLARIDYDPAMLGPVANPCATGTLPWLTVKFKTKPTQTTHYFITATYTLNGVTTESVGSEHVKVTVTP